MIKEKWHNGHIQNINWELGGQPTESVSVGPTVWSVLYHGWDPDSEEVDKHLVTFKQFDSFEKREEFMKQYEEEHEIHGV